MPRIKVYTTRKAAEKFGVHTTTIKEWAKEGKLPFTKTLGGHYRFNGTDVCRLHRTMKNDKLVRGFHKDKDRDNKTGRYTPTDDFLSTPSDGDRLRKVADVLIEVWSAIENGEVDQKFFELRAKVRNIT